MINPIRVRITNNAVFFDSLYWDDLELLRENRTEGILIEFNEDPKRPYKWRVHFNDGQKFWFDAENLELI